MATRCSEDKPVRRDECYRVWAMSSVIFILAVLLLFGGATTPYFLTRFDYDIGEESLRVTMHWCGFVNFRKSIPWSSIRAVRRATRLELVPILGGALPSLWGKFPGQVVMVVHGRLGRWFPLLITPPLADTFVEEVNTKLAEESSRGGG
jgi:hypothetical protein